MLYHTRFFHPFIRLSPYYSSCTTVKYPTTMQCKVYCAEVVLYSAYTATVVLSSRPSAAHAEIMAMRVYGIVGIGLLTLSFPQQAVGMSTKQKQRNACSGMSSGDVSREFNCNACGRILSTGRRLDVIKFFPEPFAMFSGAAQGFFCVVLLIARVKTTVNIGIYSMAGAVP